MAEGKKILHLMKQIFDVQSKSKLTEISNSPIRTIFFVQKDGRQTSTRTHNQTEALRNTFGSCRFLEGLEDGFSA
jgi:hypothetical protein